VCWKLRSERRDPSVTSSVLAIHVNRRLSKLRLTSNRVSHIYPDLADSELGFRAGFLGKQCAVVNGSPVGECNRIARRFIPPWPNGECWVGKARRPLRQETNHASWHCWHNFEHVDVWLQREL
jgi:hypothetical protein